MQNFRRALGCRALGLLERRQVQADARFQSPGTPGALGHRRLADALGHQPGKAGARIEIRYPLLGRIHHQPDAFNSQTGFRNVGRQHHFALSGRGGQDRLTLLGQR